MKVDFEQQLRALDGRILIDEGTPKFDDDGQPLRKPPTKEGEEGDFILEHNPVTLKGISINSLMMQKPQDNTKGEDKLKRYQIATKIYNDEKEFTAEDISLIKKLVGEFFGPLIVGQVWEMLEEGLPKDKKK